MLPFYTFSGFNIAQQPPRTQTHRVWSVFLPAPSLQSSPPFAPLAIKWQQRKFLTLHCMTCLNLALSAAFFTNSAALREGCSALQFFLLFPSGRGGTAAAFAKRRSRHFDGVFIDYVGQRCARGKSRRYMKKRRTGNGKAQRVIEREREGEREREREEAEREREREREIHAPYPS